MQTLLKVFLFVCLITVSEHCFAQAQLAVIADIGKSQVSKGTYLTSSLIGNYQHKNSSLSIGIENTLLGSNSSFISGFQTLLNRKLQFRLFSIDFYGLYIWNKASKLITEHNSGAFFIVSIKRFSTEFGTHFRSLSYSHQAEKDYSLQHTAGIWENWNMIYSFDFFLQPQNHYWNISCGATNRDYFSISQETNPLFYIKGMYEFKNKLKPFFETWYKSSGAFNASVNYFGFFVRTGVKWNIATKN